MNTKIYDKVLDWLEEQEQRNIEAGLGYEQSEGLDNPIEAESEAPNQGVDDYAEIDASLEKVNSDGLMDGHQTEFGVNPETGDATEGVEGPELAFQAEIMGKEARMSMRNMDKAIREIDDV